MKIGKREIRFYQNLCIFMSERTIRVKNMRKGKRRYTNFTRLIPDEITKFIKAQGDIWGKFRGFETVLILRLHMYHFSSFRILHFGKQA